jgi:hypothetical protein
MQKILLYPFVLLLFISCRPEKDDNGPEKKCRLVKLIQGTHNGAGDDTTYLFKYGASGKITHITESNPKYNYTHEYDLTYNDSGRLARVVSPTATNYYKYKANGLLEEVTTVYFVDTSRFRFDYGSSTVPQKCFRYHYFTYFKKWDTLEYRYTSQNGNITTRETFIDGVSIFKYNYEYDTIPNVNPDLILIGFNSVVMIGLYDEYLYFNKNVLKKKTSNDGNLFIKYQLESERIVKSVDYYLQAPALTDTSGNTTRNYFYECP